MIHEFKIITELIKGYNLLVPQPCNDNYLIQFKRYLFEHRGDIPYILEILQNPNSKGYGGNQMYTRMEGPVIFIYDGYDDDPEELGIRIPRSDLIKIFEAWQEVNTKSINTITFQRDEQHINMIVTFDDGSEFQRTFNYKVI